MLYEIIYAIIFGVGAHLGVPGTLKVGQNCQNFKIFVFGRSGLKFSRCSHILLYEIIYAIFLGIGVHLGAQGLSKLVQIVQILFIFVFGRRSFRFS